MRLIIFHLLKMHYFNIHGVQCTKLEFGQALRHTKFYHLLINLLGKKKMMNNSVWVAIILFRISSASKAYFGKFKGC